MILPIGNSQNAKKNIFCLLK